MPCFNAERWLAYTLESALAQTWRSTEIIVVDDGSSDASCAILKNYEQRGLKFVQQPNAGASVARNHALQLAQGDFIQFLDADDLIDPVKIETQVRRLQADGTENVAAGAWVRFRSEPDELQTKSDPIWRDLEPVEWLIISWLGGGNMPVHSWLTPRSIIEKAGPWDNTRCPNDDGEFFTRVVLNSRRVLFCEEARSYYRSGIGGSLSGQKSASMLAATLRSIELCTSNLLNAENSARTRAACAAQFQRFAYDVYPLMPDLVRLAENRIRELGGSSLKIDEGGRIFRLLLRSFGWKPARRVQNYYRSIRA